MVNRYSITDNPHQFSNENLAWEPRYNASPSHKLPVLTAEGSVSMLNWGLMVKMSTNKATSAKLFNTPLQSVFTKASTKTAMKQRRCIILGDGVFLWKQIGKKKQVPYYFYQDNRKVFGMAGYWESSEDLEGNEFKCFMMITGTHPQLTTYQNDSAIFIDPIDFKTWLDPSQPQDILMGVLENSSKVQFVSHAVSPAILNDELNYPELIGPATPSDQHGNYTLF